VRPTQLLAFLYSKVGILDCSIINLSDSFVEEERFVGDKEMEVFSFNSNEVQYKIGGLDEPERKFIAENPFNPLDNFELEYTIVRIDDSSIKDSFFIYLDEVSGDDDILHVYDLSTKELLYDLNIESFDRLYSDFRAVQDGIMIYFALSNHAVLLDYETGCVIKEITFEIGNEYMELFYFDDDILIVESHDQFLTNRSFDASFFE